MHKGVEPLSQDRQSSIITTIQERKLIHPIILNLISSSLSIDFLILFPHIQVATIQPERYIATGRRFPSIIINNF